MIICRKKFVSILQLSQHPDQHCDQRNGEAIENSLIEKEDFKGDEKSNPQPDVTKEEFCHFETNGSKKVNFVK